MAKNFENMNFPKVNYEGDILDMGPLLDPKHPGHYKESAWENLANEPDKFDPAVAEKLRRHLDDCMRNPSTGRPSCKEIYEEYLLKQPSLIDE